MTTGGTGMTVIILLDIAFVPALPGLLHHRLDAEGAARLRIQLGLRLPRRDDPHKAKIGITPPAALGR